MKDKANIHTSSAMNVLYNYFMLCPTSKPSKTPQSTSSQPSEWHGRGLSIGGRGADQFVGDVEKRPKIVAAKMPAGARLGRLFWYKNTFTTNGGAGIAS